jgi:hypothetical protein
MKLATAESTLDRAESRVDIMDNETDIIKSQVLHAESQINGVNSSLSHANEMLNSQLRQTVRSSVDAGPTTIYRLATAAHRDAAKPNQIRTHYSQIRPVFCQQHAH